MKDFLFINILKFKLIKIVSIISISIILYLQLQCNFKQAKPLVKILKHDTIFSLEYKDKPFFIKGIVSAGFLEKAKLYGANSVRVWDSREDAENAEKMGLTVMYNLSVSAQRDGFDFDDPKAISEQKEQILKTVKSLMGNKAILFWSIGNELDYVPVLKPYNKKVWDVVEDIAKEIKKIDKDRLVLTVIGMSMMEKVAEIRQQCPSLDLLGLNAYGDIEEIPGILEKYSWNKPYLITEWGPTGYWQTKKTEWGAPFEENSSQKADMYLKRYENVILKDSGKCLGSYVFLWTSGKQETTHTWFGMFDETGNETEAVGIMQKMWSGESPKNHAPRIDSMCINDMAFPNSIFLTSEGNCTARVYCSDNDSLSMKWEIRPEAEYSDYAGHGEKTPPVVRSKFIPSNSKSMSFITPKKSGAYRLFVYIYDTNGHVATANLPFYAKNISN